MEKVLNNFMRLFFLIFLFFFKNYLFFIDQFPVSYENYILLQFNNALIYLEKFFINYKYE
jgi:hypothetical protein